MSTSRRFVEPGRRSTQPPDTSRSTFRVSVDGPTAQTFGEVTGTRRAERRDEDDEAELRQP